ncbi:MAG: DUF3656 domain-containing protein [Clostridia bacterium]|nr:DUF3656 domain-containing protein [Clostridia bacterium]
MKRSTALPELLAPAGSPEALYAAIGAGADAVYLGGRHSARAFAKNFDEAALGEAVRYAHLHGVRVYLALNTLLFDRELGEVLSYADRVAALGMDAAIVADTGLLSLLHRHLPALPLHASTQGFIHSTDTADLYASLGATRVVAARELSLDGICRMVEGSTAEVEVFLHGALCVSHSGQCLFSSLVGGRSGNRGECAQPCRLPYGKGYPLSLSDLALGEHIPALLASGVASLKIEGRMKAPAYVAGVTALYRRLLDEGRSATREELEEAAALFSRGGFTDRYFTARHREPMTGVRSAADKAATRERQESFTFTPKSVTGMARIVAGEPARLSLTLGERTVTVTGEVPAAAKSAPLTKEEVRGRLSRLGGTFLRLAPHDLTLTLGEGLFLTAGALNALRRAAATALMGEEQAPLGVVYEPSPCTPPEGLPYRTARCETKEQFRAAADGGFFDRLYLPLSLLAEEGIRGAEVAMPSVITDAERPRVLAMLTAARAAGARYALCESYGQLALVREAGLLPVGGHRLNVTNRESAAALLSLGVSDLLLSPELSAVRLASLPHRAIVYGRIPLMLTERCFVREGFGCRACGRAALTDRRGVRFPLMREWEHRTVVLNSRPTYLADRPDLTRAVTREHYLFTIETEKECRAVIAAARCKEPLAGEVRRLPTP